MKNRSETKLRQSESKRIRAKQTLQKKDRGSDWTIFENIQEGYYETNLAGDYTFFNSSMAKILGYTREEMMGMNYRQYMDEENAKKVFRDFNKIYRTGIPSQVDYEQIRKDGSKMFVETSVALIRNSSGQPTGFRGIVRDITERKRSEDEIQRNYDIQHVLNLLLRHSLRNIPLEEIIQKALDLVISIPWLALEAKGGIFLVEGDPGVLVMKAQSNLEEPISMMCARVPFGKCLCGRAASMQEIQFSDHLDERHEISYEGMPPHGHYCVPIVSAGRTIGAITLYIREGHRRDQKEEGFLTAIADSLAGIIERKRTEEKLEDALESLRKSFGVTIQVMVSAIEARDPYTAGHQLQVADLTRSIATEMKLSKDQIDGIRIAGSIHDLGKLAIPAEILSKPTKLTEVEFSLIKEHPRKGYEMLKNIDSPWPLAEIVYQHHERMDGSGYPRNLKGDEIIMEARILAVADTVEAMASHRPYRPGLGLDAALEEIEKNRGNLYDKAVVNACLALFRKKGFQFEGNIS